MDVPPSHPTTRDHCERDNARQLSLHSDSLRSRRGTPEETFRAEVFVDIGPMDAVAGAAHLPVLTLFSRGVEEARVPG